MHGPFCLAALFDGGKVPGRAGPSKSNGMWQCRTPSVISDVAAEGVSSMQHPLGTVSHLK